MAPDKGDGFELMVSPGWQSMEGVSSMKKGEQFRFPLDWLGMDLGGRVQDTSGYSQFGFEFGNLRAVYRKPGKGGVLVVFTSWGGTRDSLPEGIKRYLDSVVPDNKPESLQRAHHLHVDVVLAFAQRAGDLNLPGLPGYQPALPAVH